MHPQVAKALAYIHSHSRERAHGDVRSDNILLTDSDLDVAYAKVTDLRPHRCLTAGRAEAATTLSSGPLQPQRSLAQHKSLPEHLRLTIQAPAPARGCSAAGGSTEGTASPVMSRSSSTCSAASAGACQFSGRSSPAAPRTPRFSGCGSGHSVLPSQPSSGAPALRPLQAAPADVAPVTAPSAHFESAGASPPWSPLGRSQQSKSEALCGPLSPAAFRSGSLRRADTAEASVLEAPKEENAGSWLLPDRAAAQPALLAPSLFGVVHTVREDEELSVIRLQV